MKILTFVFFILLSKYGKTLKFIQSIFFLNVDYRTHDSWVQKVRYLISTLIEWTMRKWQVFIVFVFFTRRGYFFWRTVPFCLMYSLIVLYIQLALIVLYIHLALIVLYWQLARIVLYIQLALIVLYIQLSLIVLYIQLALIVLYIQLALVVLTYSLL